jgi:hypothetical protein
LSAHVGFERISAFLDGELAEAERLEVQGHLEGCPDCADQLVQLIGVDQAARGEGVQAPEGYFEALPDRIRKRLRQKRRPAVPAWGWAVAAALMLAVMTPLVWRDPFDRWKQPAVLEEKPAHASPVPAPREVPPTFVPGPQDLKKPAPPVAQLQQPRPSPVPPPKPAESEGRAAARERFEEKKDADRDAALRDEGPRGPAGFAAPPAPAAAPAVPPPPAPAPAFEEEARPAEKEEAEPSSAAEGAPGQAAGGSLAKARRKQDDEQERADASKRAMTTTQSRSSAPRTVADARSTREDWRRRAMQHPEGREGDEARFRLVEASAEAYRLSSDPEDLRILRNDVAAYLAHRDARHPERAREILRSAEEG